MSNIVDVTSPEHFKELLSADLNRVSCLNFWAPWAEPCAAFTEVVKSEAGKFSSVLFLNVSLEFLTHTRVVGVGTKGEKGDVND
jgi:thioredoxin-like negative regulator of GroEL